MRERLEYIRAAAWMSPYRTPLGRSELGVVVKDVSESLMDLSDVMKQRNALDASPRGFVEVRCLGEYQSVVGDAPNVRVFFA